MPAALASLDTLIHERRLWPAAGQAAGRPGEPTGHPVLDTVLPGGGWPGASLLELLLPMDGVGELRLLLPRQPKPRLQPAQRRLHRQQLPPSARQPNCRAHRATPAPLRCAPARK